MKELCVNTSTKYKVTIEEEFTSFGSFISPLLNGEKVCVITDRNVFPLFYDLIKNSICEKQVLCYKLKAGEKSKNAKNYIKIQNFLAKNQFTREDTIIALGGGVVGDLAGFVSSTFMRGINFINVPTTLLAVVDSCIGGKTAINLDKGKNLCGTFYQPKGVYVCLEFLKTLPEKEIKNGYGEIAKYSFLESKKIDLDLGITEDLIYECLKIKKDIVEKDEKESGVRKLLNFGHTFGHAIEKISKFKLPHGECVALGIAIALKISKKFYGENNFYINAFEKIAKLLKINTDINIDKQKIIDSICSDKKRIGNSIDFVLIDDTGKPKIQPIEIDKIKDYL